MGDRDWCALCYVWKRSLTIGERTTNSITVVADERCLLFRSSVAVISFIWYLMYSTLGFGHKSDAWKMSEYKSTKVIRFWPTPSRSIGPRSADDARFLDPPFPLTSYSIFLSISRHAKLDIRWQLCPIMPNTWHHFTWFLVYVTYYNKEWNYMINAKKPFGYRVAQNSPLSTLFDLNSRLIPWGQSLIIEILCWPELTFE